MPRTFLESLYKLDRARRCSHGGLATVRALDAVGAAVVVLDGQEPPPDCSSDYFHVTDIAFLAQRP